MDFLQDWLGVGPASTIAAATIVLGSGVAVLFIMRAIVLPRANRLARRTAFRWDDVISDRRLRRWLALLSSAIFVRLAGPSIPGLGEFWVEAWIRVSGGIAIVFGTFTLNALLMAFNSVYETLDISRSRPIKGYLQVLQIVFYILGDVWVLSVLTGQSIWYFLSGLGAAAAILLLLYRETILSLAASIQLAQNDMLRVGDWIEMEQFDANGTVVDIALTTVKVQNWDKTVTSIPTYRLTSEAFKNWRSVEELGLRRIKRSINLDISSIHFESEVENRTNLDSLTEHLLEWLRAIPQLETEKMPLMVRQLQPGHHGLPIEIYAFTRLTDWKAYEALQSYIISHTVAVLGRFGLRAFQEPTDAAMRSIRVGDRFRSLVATAGPPSAP
ncbi:MAG: mechanosensitive ion channel family protein [Acidimicrobiia bacterium]|nr:mechanosensitive ion channel family protein [Acidimicrobiia bacterium]